MLQSAGIGILFTAAGDPRRAARIMAALIIIKTTITLFTLLNYAVSTEGKVGSLKTVVLPIFYMK